MVANIDPLVKPEDDVFLEVWNKDGHDQQSSLYLFMSPHRMSGELATKDALVEVNAR
jgi:hypothetical protein